MSIINGISGIDDIIPDNAESSRYENKDIRIVRKKFQVNKGDLRNHLFPIYFKISDAASK